MLKALNTQNRESLLRKAWWLSIFTITYNLAEGLISTGFGMSDDTLALFGFGVDSFVEVISGLGIAHMVWRMRRNGNGRADRFEIMALRITGTGFYLLTAGLLIGSLYNIIVAARPETTLVGIIVSSISILTMYFLFRAKLEVGRALDSAPIVSDASCTKTCFYLSFILLASSLLYEWLHIPYIDALGSLGIAWFAFSEGREAFEKAASGNMSCSCSSEQ